MHIYSVIGAVSTVVVGGGVATGLGFALKPNSSDNQSTQENSNQELIAPAQPLHSNNYLVFTKSQKPANSPIKLTCSQFNDCQLFKRQSKSTTPLNKFSEIRPGNRYVLNIENSDLKLHDVVEFQSDADKKMWLVVQSNSVSDKSSKIEAVIKPPTNLVPKETLKTLLNGDDIKTNQNAIQTIRYYYDQYEAFIDRGQVDHKTFVILKWESSTNGAVFLEDKTDNTKVDFHVFNAFEEQQKEEINILGQLTVDIGASAKAYVEIYEIKNQQTVINAIASINGNGAATQQPDWKALAKENIMVTKLSQLEDGKYYKFVFSDETPFNDWDNELPHLQIQQKYASNKHRYLFKANLDEGAAYCIKTTTTKIPTNNCFKDSS